MLFTVLIVAVAVMSLMLGFNIGAKVGVDKTMVEVEGLLKDLHGLGVSQETIDLALARSIARMDEKPKDTNAVS